MKQLFINIIFCAIATVILLVAPDYYSFRFCSTILGLYIIQNFLFWVTKPDKNFVCFEFFFMISFGLTNFIYPVVYYQINPVFSLFEFSFNENLISKCTAIAFFAYTFYILGVTQIKKVETESSEVFFKFGEKQISILFFLTVGSFILFVIVGGLTHLQNVYSDGGDIQEVGIYSYFNNLFVVFCYLILMFVFRQKSKIKMLIFSAIVLIFIILLLMTGSRTQPLAFGLILITAFGINIRKLRTYEFLIILAVGISVMSFVVLARTSNISKNSWMEVAKDNIDFTSYFDVFSDLIINNRNLYVLVDYADNVQHTYFTGFISDITSPVPGLTRFIIENSNSPPELMTSTNLPTYWEFGADSQWGLGTNMVGDAYLAFGLPGVIFFFFFLGIIIRKSRAMMNYNIYAYVIYFLFVSHSVFYSRAGILFNPRYLVWSLLIIFAFQFFSRYKYKLNYTE
ncbi:MAG: O-antigen polysaccharide polymerase Wzy [Paludibacter sp.]|nr:O-antigen polysaccharide polymerase Wzy [Paludibacter sp.]